MTPQYDLEEALTFAGFENTNSNYSIENETGKIYKLGDKTFFIGFKEGLYSVTGEIPDAVWEAIISDNPAATYSDKYVRKCTFGNKEDFTLFLYNLKAFYSEEALIGRKDLTKKKIEMINPGISAEDWMQGDKTNIECYKNIHDENKTRLSPELIKAISDFDQAVNPFISGDINYDNVDTKNIEISANSNNRGTDDKRASYCDLKIVTPDTKNNVRYARYHNGFWFSLEHYFDNGNYLFVRHFFSTNSSNETDNGEILCVQYSESGDTEKDKKEIDIRYNLGRGQVGDAYSKKTKITEEQLLLLFKKLVEATKYASNITESIIKKPPVKKFDPPKN